ncbi:MAG: T6SS phospholipase effector Tle1-like catalytic domain-containing protein [Steroidobacteraceae bacterium]
MGRNLVICCDGTNNEFGSENTSVVRIVEVLNRDPQHQLVFYDPGVGTLPEEGLVTSAGKWLSKAFGLAFGIGLMRNVDDAYRFLMRYWQPGDRVFLFGFSRGAYTVRALASMLHMFGLLPAGNENLLPYVLRLFKSSGKKLKKKDSRASREYWNLCDSFRQTFARAIPERPDRRFQVHFMGAWDTVSSVGWMWDPVRLPFTRSNPSVAIVRHAVAIDERRCFFRQNLFTKAGAQDLQELWFAGVHSDVGGGYPEADGGLWREAYSWMLTEAKSAQLVALAGEEQRVLSRVQAPLQPWCEKQHESLTVAWWIAEFFPKLPHRKKGLPWPRLGLGSRRRLPKGSRLHPSVVRRLCDLGDGYAPKNLSPQFMAALRKDDRMDPVVPL